MILRALGCGSGHVTHGYCSALVGWCQFGGPWSKSVENTAQWFEHDVTPQSFCVDGPGFCPLGGGEQGLFPLLVALPSALPGFGKGGGATFEGKTLATKVSLY